MKLAVFDIDGTLTHTNKVDGEAFCATFKQLHGISDLSTNWSAYTYSTDSGILDEVFKRRLGRAATQQDINAFVDHFVLHLKSAQQRDANYFREISGAKDLLLALEDSGWSIAIATGAWRRSAEFKLSQVGIDFEKRPFAFSEDDFERSRIINAAIARAKVRDKVSAYERSIYIGDGAWDLKSAIELKMPFIRIGKFNESAVEIEDYADLPYVLSLFDSAPVASGTAST